VERSNGDKPRSNVRYSHAKQASGTSENQKK